MNLISFCISAVQPLLYLFSFTSNHKCSVFVRNGQHSIKLACHSINRIKIHSFCLEHILISEYLVDCK